MQQGVEEGHVRLPEPQGWSLGVEVWAGFGAVDFFRFLQRRYCVPKKGDP